MRGNGYKGEFSISYRSPIFYKNSGFSLTIEGKDGESIARKTLSSPEAVFKEIDSAIDFTKDTDAEYKLDMTRRARCKLGKWADAIEGDVEAANTLNFPRGKIMELKAYFSGSNGEAYRRIAYLMDPPTAERPCPIRRLGPIIGGNMHITNPSIDASLLFPHAVEG